MTASLPFDQPHDESIAECVRLSSLDTLGREVARRCAQAADMAEAAKERARTSDDLVEIAAAAELAQESSMWCGRLASAVTAILGEGDVVEVKRCWALVREAGTHAALAATRWRLMKRAKGGAVV